ncbi:MAG TPA: ATP-dependent Clp protease proteolytic subunit [Acidimicrobiia bacterium]
MNPFDPGTGRDPFGGPLDQDPADWVRAHLRGRRIVTLTGRLDDALASMVAAELMALDADGDDAIALQVDCEGGTVEAAFMLMDTIDLLGVPVRARCVGRAEGVGTGIVAVASSRAATPHARFRLSVPEVSFAGSAANLEVNVREHQRRLEQFVSRLATATGRPFEHVEADVERGRWLDAEEALVYGLIDEIERPEHGPDDEPRRPRFGFA